MSDMVADQLTYHPVTQQITTLLEEHGYWFETFEHEPVRTSEEAARTRPGYGLHQGAKAIVVRREPGKDGKPFVMLVIPADRRFDSRKVKQLVQARRVRFATDDEIAALTGGVLPGAIPPFGALFGLPVYADKTLFANDRIVFNAGDRRFSVAMGAEDYRSLASPAVVSIL